MPKCRQTFQSTSHGTPPRRLLKIDGTKVTIMNWRKSAICRAWRAAQGGRRPDLFGCIHGRMSSFVSLLSARVQRNRSGSVVIFRIYVSSFDLAISAIHTIRLYYYVVSRTTRCAETRDIRRDSRYTRPRTNWRPDTQLGCTQSRPDTTRDSHPRPSAPRPDNLTRTIPVVVALSRYCRDEIHEKPPGPFSQSDGVHASIRHLLGELKGSSGGAQP